jgi:thiosulfate dehydrogenase (quinone)
LKLDFDAPGFVAAKLTHALPGALWVQGPIEWTLRHPDLIVASVWLWTFAELAIGLGLMLGLATRLAAFGSFWLNVVLMLIFGWMGSTCLDEWTMAVSGVAMSSAVFLAGGGEWSLGERYIAPTGWAQRMPWLNWICSGPLPSDMVPKLALWLGGVSIAFTLVTYYIYFGAVVTPLHSRVNFHKHDIALTHAQLAPDGATPTSMPAPTRAPPTSSRRNLSTPLAPRLRGGMARRSRRSRRARSATPTPTPGPPNSSRR